MQAMNTWSTIIAKLAAAPNGHNPVQTQAEALIQVKTEYTHVKKGFDGSAKDLQTLEQAYQQAKLALSHLEQQNHTVEQDTQAALAQQEPQKALALAQHIAQIQASLSDNRQKVAHLEENVLALKGAVSHNRYHLFRLEQQLDTLNATTQLQQAQAQQQAHKGLRTALHSMATLNARAASNDANTRTAQRHTTAPLARIESVDEIVARLKN